jgi:putative ABC transport system permease protein
VLSLDGDLPIADVTTVSASMDASMASQRLTAVLLGIFAALALTLASLGLYGVMALGVTQRTRELGIRLALGAQRSAVLGLVLRQGVGLVGIGLGIGLVAALALGHLLTSAFYGVSGGNVETLLWVCLVLAATALTACWVPAHRATRVDPMVALRDE